MEMSCPWLDNRTKKESAKTSKQQPLRWELTKKYPGYKMVPLKVIMEVLTFSPWWSKELDFEMSKIFGARSSDIQ